MSYTLILVFTNCSYMKLLFAELEDRLNRKA